MPMHHQHAYTFIQLTKDLFSVLFSVSINARDTRPGSVFRCQSNLTKAID